PQPTSTHAQTATSPTRRSSDLATGDLAQHHLLLPRVKVPPNDLPGLRLVEAERAGPPRIIEPGAVGTRCRPERVVPVVARLVGLVADRHHDPRLAGERLLDQLVMIHRGKIVADENGLPVAAPGGG